MTHSYSIGDGVELTLAGSSRGGLLSGALVPAAVQALPVHRSSILRGSYAGYLFVGVKRSVLRVQYSARVARTIAVASLYSDVIKYIEGNRAIFDPALADVAIDELRRRCSRRLT